MIKGKMSCSLLLAVMLKTFMTSLMVLSLFSTELEFAIISIFSKFSINSFKNNENATILKLFKI